MKGNIKKSAVDVMKRWVAAVIQGLEKYADKEQLGFVVSLQYTQTLRKTQIH